MPIHAWRPATPADDEAIVEMCLELNREDPGPRPVPASHTHRTLAELRAVPTRGQAWVCGPEPVGYAFLISFWSNELGGEILTVDELFVRKEHRCGGLGRALFEMVLAQKHRYVAVDLEVTPANARAHALYESLGFRPLKNRHLRVRF